MSGRRLYVAPGRLASGEVKLTEAEERYLVRVLRLRPGDGVTVFDGYGVEVDAVLGGGEPSRLVLGERRTVPLPAGSRITLLQGVAKGERMDVVVQKTTELGIAVIVPVLTARCVPHPGAASQRIERWRRIAAEAARQCGRADVPEIQAPVSLAAALAAAGAEGSSRFALWELEHERSLGRALAAATLPGEVVLLVGPEGGLDPSEAEQAAAGGFELVGLGPRILRTETAAVVAVTLVQAASGAFG